MKFPKDEPWRKQVSEVPYDLGSKLHLPQGMVVPHTSSLLPDSFGVFELSRYLKGWVESQAPVVNEFAYHKSFDFIEIPSALGQLNYPRTRLKDSPQMCFPAYLTFQNGSEKQRTQHLALTNWKDEVPIIYASPSSVPLLDELAIVRGLAHYAITNQRRTRPPKNETELKTELVMSSMLVRDFISSSGIMKWKERTVEEFDGCLTGRLDPEYSFAVDTIKRRGSLDIVKRYLDGDNK